MTTITWWVVTMVVFVVMVMLAMVVMVVIINKKREKNHNAKNNAVIKRFKMYEYILSVISVIQFHKKNFFRSVPTCNYKE